MPRNRDGSLRTDDKAKTSFRRRIQRSTAELDAEFVTYPQHHYYHSFHSPTHLVIDLVQRRHRRMAVQSGAFLALRPQARERPRSADAAAHRPAQRHGHRRHTAPTAHTACGHGPRSSIVLACQQDTGR